MPYIKLNVSNRFKQWEPNYHHLQDSWKPAEAAIASVEHEP